MKAVVLLVLALGLAGCDQDKSIEASAPKDELEFSRRHLSLYPERNFPEIERQMDPTLHDDPELRAKLTAMADLFPREPLNAARLVSFSISEQQSLAFVSDDPPAADDDVWQARFVFEYQYAQSLVLATVVVQRRPQGLTVVGAHVQPISEELQRYNAFTFEGKGTLHYLFLALAVAVPILIVVAFVQCLRTPLRRWKWLWLVLIPFGFVAFSFNWSTGDIGVQFFNVQILGAGFLQMSYEPLYLTVSIPIGALIFLARRKELRVISAE